jgi:MFS family permease
MMKRLRGRNLKHPGCLVGVTLGVILGIIIAGVMASVYNVPLNTILWTWLGMILVLGALGWIIGSRLSSRFPVEEAPEDTLLPVTNEITDAPPAPDDVTSPSPPTSDEINITQQ